MSRLVSRLRARRVNSESGFTLIELIISVVLLAMVTGALGAAFVTSLNSSANTAQRVRESNDAQVIAAYLVRDAQAAGGSNPLTGVVDPAYGVSVNWKAENGGTDPDPAGCNASDTLIARFAWADRVDSSTTHIHLAKYYYVPAAGSVPGQLVRRTCLDGASQGALTIGRRIGSNPAAPSATCAPVADCPGIPDTVQLTVSEDNKPVTNTSGPYTFTLTASVRPSSDAPPPDSTNSAAIPMLALGGGTCSGASNAAGFDIEGNPTARVYGGIAVNGATSPGCPWYINTGSVTLEAAGAPQQTAIPDPYAGLPTPAGTCPAGGGVNPAPVGGVYQPGVYPQALPANAALAPGVFVLCANAPSGLHGNGVMLYLAKGTVTWSGGNTNLTASSTGPYAGIVIWQPASNPAVITVQGNAGLTLGTATPAVSPPMGSVLYAPAAEVDLTGTADLFLGGIVAKTILITGNHQVTIGVPPASLPQITSPPQVSALPDGLVGKFYSLQYTAVGGSGGLSWSAVAGTLPPGLSINASTGLVSGTPTTSGNYNPTIRVTDNLGDIAQQANPLWIAPKPTVTSIVPSSRGQGATSQTIQINGTGFVNGATVTFSGSGITVNSTTWVSATRINVIISIAANAPTSARNVTVTNPDTGTNTVVGTFTVNPAPSITSVSPAGQGATSWVVPINGANFVNGATVAFSGTGVTLNSVAFVSSTQLNANITVAANAPLGASNVTVTNPDAGVSTGVGVFTVNPAPTITSVTPASLATGSTNVNVTITGTNFVNGALLAVTFSGTRITVNSTTWSSATTIVVNITIAGNAQKNARDVTLLNGDGGTVTKVGGFTVI